MKETIEYRKLVKMYLNEENMFQLQQTELGSFGHLVLALESRNLPLRLSRVAEASCMAGVPLYGGSERPLHNVVKVKPGMLWRQYVSDARAMG